MWWQNLKMKLVFASFVLIVFLILFLSFCYSNGNDCTKKEERRERSEREEARAARTRKGTSNANDAKVYIKRQPEDFRNR